MDRRLDNGTPPVPERLGKVCGGSLCGLLDPGRVPEGLGGSERHEVVRVQWPIGRQRREHQRIDVLLAGVARRGNRGVGDGGGGLDGVGRWGSIVHEKGAEGVWHDVLVRDDIER